jgi:hypothetical protein
MRNTRDTLVAYCLLHTVDILLRITNQIKTFMNMRTGVQIRCQKEI